MGAATQSQVDKRPYKNQTAGWLGVVKLDHLGAQVGHSIPPHGTVWLSDDEAVLTSRAPAQAKDNPFVEQTFNFIDHNDGDKIVEVQMPPLVLVEDTEEGQDASERFVPTPAHVSVAGEARVTADLRNTETALSGADRPVPTTPVEPTLAPSALAAVPPSQATRTGPISHGQAQPPEADVSESWVENAERTEAPKAGILGGTEAPSGPQQGADPGPSGGGGPSPAAAATVDPASTAPGAVAPQNAGPVPSESAGTGDQAGAPSEQGTVAEEHAAHIESGEETGAAATPAQQAPEGEYAANEEVGSPDAPTQGES